MERQLRIWESQKIILYSSAENQSLEFGELFLYNEKLRHKTVIISLLTISILGLIGLLVK